MRPIHIAMTMAILAAATVLAGSYRNTGSCTSAAGCRNATPGVAVPGVVTVPRKGPDEWLHMRRMYGSKVSIEQIARASADAIRLRREAEARAPGTLAAWSFLGPENVGGRLLDIALDPADGNTIYVGSASGGVWKTHRRRPHLRVRMAARQRAGGGRARHDARTGCCTPAPARRAPAAAASPSAARASSSRTTAARAGTRSASSSSERISRVAIDPDERAAHLRRGGRAALRARRRARRLPQRERRAELAARPRRATTTRPARRTSTSTPRIRSASTR